MLDINFYEKELQKELARKDHLEFIKYTWECTAPYLVGYHIKLICNRIDDVIEKFRNGESSFTIISIPYRHGKKLYVNDLVITPQGFRKHGDIKPGDYVCGRKGHPVKVIAKTSVTNDLDNLITFSDGTQLTCHDNHEWVVWDRSRRIERIVETWEMASHLYNGTRPRFLVDSNICIDFPEKPLSIHPYVLGVWLGDGSTGKNNINMSKQDYAVSEKMELLGYKITGRSAHKDTGVLSIYFRKLYKELKNENLLNNKHIPDNYIYNSKKNRLELLAGLIDTDGYINKKDGRVCFSNTNKQIVDTVKILVNSLGKRVTICKYKARTSSSGIIGKKDVYQVLLSLLKIYQRY